MKVQSLMQFKFNMPKDTELELSTASFCISRLGSPDSLGILFIYYEEFVSQQLHVDSLQKGRGVGIHKNKHVRICVKLTLVFFRVWDDEFLIL